MDPVGTKPQCIEKIIEKSLVFRFRMDPHDQSLLITTPGTSATRLSHALLVSTREEVWDKTLAVRHT